MIVKYKTSKAIAQAVTFTFSAVLHEFLLALIFRILYPIFLLFIVFQIPLIYMTRFMKGRKSGNYLFWVGIIIGPTLIISIYLKIDKQVTQMFTDPTTHEMIFPN
jgi:sterol O-acyltransferase